jgi:hypothetical protein
MSVVIDTMFALVKSKSNKKHLIFIAKRTSR